MFKHMMWFLFFFVIFVCCGGKCVRKVDLGRSSNWSGMQETEPFHIVSPSDWPSQTPASRPLLAQGLRTISSSGLTRPSRLILPARAVNVVLLSVPPFPRPWEAVLCFDGLFLFLEKCSSVTTTETAGLLLQDKWSEEWLGEDRDQTCGCKPLWKAMTGSRVCWLYSVLQVLDSGDVY